MASLNEFIESHKKTAYQRPAIDLKQYAQTAMRGQNFNITGYWNKVPDQKISTYQNTI